MPIDIRQVFSTLVLLVALGIGGVASAQESSPGTLSLSGEGRVAAAPDLATITLGVVTQGKTAAEALAENTARLSGVFGVLDDVGIAPENRQTSGLSIQPEWTRPRSQSDTAPPRISGYRVSNTVTVRVHEIDALGDVLDAVVRSGANTFQGLSFGVTEDQALRDAARQAAVKDVLAKAELYAAALDVELGDIVSMSEHGGMQQPVLMRGEAMAMASDMAAPVPIAGGEVVFTAGVSIVFALIQ